MQQTFLALVVGTSAAATIAMAQTKSLKFMMHELEVV